VLKQLRNREDWTEKSVLQKGFTLVELLVVIVILGILAAVVVFAVSGSTDTAKTNACAAEKSAVETAVEAYQASTGSYPTNATNLTDTSTKFLRSEPKYYTVSGSSVTKKSTAPSNCS
jgi:type II secretion system protein G